MTDDSGCDPQWSSLRCALELRKQDYLVKVCLDQCLKHARPAEDPALRDKYKNNVYSICDSAAQQLSFAGENVPRAIARLATGIFPWHLDSSIPPSTYAEQARSYWQSALTDTFNHLEQLQDTADFHATHILRLFYLFGGAAPDPTKLPPHGVPTDMPPTMPADIARRLYDALHRFKYWIDEPPTLAPNGEEMTFWSENHQIEFASAQYLAGQLWENDYFPHGGVYGRDHKRRARARLVRWLDHRLSFGFSEWNGPGYYNEDFPPLLNLVDFCDDREICRKAAMVLDILIFDLARFTAQGSFGPTAGRAYFEHKNCGLEQSVGDLIEVLFGTRGLYVETSSDSAVALATSTRYIVPDVLLAIGQDRPSRFIDRTRVSIDIEEAAKYGIGFSSEDDVIFWWGNGAFYTSQTIDGTKQVARERNLVKSGPFKPLSYELDGPIADIATDLATVVASGAAEAALLGAASVVPPPFNLAFGAAALAIAPVTIGATLDSVENLAEDVVNLAEAGVQGVVDVVAGLFGAKRSSHRRIINRAAIFDAVEKLLVEFGTGSALTRANLYTYRNADVMLSSVQNHRAGQIGAQKHPWQATLGLKASVWTTKPLLPAGGSETAAFFGSFADEVRRDHTKAVIELVLPHASKQLADALGHDGPNQWTGSLTLPMIVQHENALIAAYDPSNLQRALSPALTHAWFPTPFFDVDSVEQHEHWTFGRVGDGYVGLFSAQPPQWSLGDFRDKELVAPGHRNIWICQVGNAEEYGSYRQFIARVKGARVNVLGLNTATDHLECSYEMPTPQGTVTLFHRLELRYGIGGSVDGLPMLLDNFPRFDNPYGRAEWGQHSYTIRHGKLQLRHQLDGATRRGDGI